MTKILSACLLSLIVFAACVHTASADDLDLIASPATPPEEMGNAYERLTHADFPAIAPKLARLLGDPHLYLSGIGPRTAQPWDEKPLLRTRRIYAQQAMGLPFVAGETTGTIPGPHAFDRGGS